MSFILIASKIQASAFTVANLPIKFMSLCYDLLNNEYFFRLVIVYEF